MAIFRFVPFLAALCALPAFACGLEPGPRPQFDVWEYQVTGNSKLETTAIEKAVYAFLGPDRTIVDVDMACAALEKVYRDAGFVTVTVDIPEQSTADGVVELRVLEARVDRVKVSGARYHAPDRLLDDMSAIAEGEVPDFKALSQQMEAANRNPDLRVQPLLRPGRNPGTTEVELKVDDSLPVHGNAELNNRYGTSRAVDPGYERASATLRYDNLWQRGHSLAFSWLTSPGHSAETQVGSLAYTLPVGNGERSLTVYGVHSNSNADLTTSLAGSNILGRSDIVGLRYGAPVGDGHPVQSLTLGLDYKHVREDQNVAEVVFAKPLTYWLGSVQYALSLPDSGGETSLGAGTSLSLRGLRNNDEQFDQKRFLGQSNLAVLRWDMQRLQKLTAGFTLTARLEGQLASRPLPSTEEYAAGGADSVRGYPEGVQVGDQGIRAMLEVRTPNLLAAGEGPQRDLRLLAFVEGARLQILDPLPGQIDRFNLASAGFGLRMASPRGYALAADYARRLKDGLTADTHGSVAAGGSRFHVSATYAF